MWLSVLFGWIGVHFFGAGLGWIWIAFGLVTTPASLLMFSVFRRRIGQYQSGQRKLPETTESFAHG